MKDIRRGYHEDDHKLFGEDACRILSSCADDITYLLNRGYGHKQAITFVGNHYLLSERQRTALMRITCSDEMYRKRKQKQLPALPQNCTVHVDAFNAVVLLETALSGSMILRGRDGCYRDLSGLAGTYSVIAKTMPAAEMIIGKLKEHGVREAVFWVDSPVSNSGRLKQVIAEAAEKRQLPIDIQMVRNADTELKKQENVITGDSVILEECISWYNLYEELIQETETPWVVKIQQRN